MPASIPTSSFLAQLIGPVFIAVGLAALLNATVFRQVAEQFLASHALMFFAGMLTMIAGVAIVLLHNVWVAGWPAVITVLGWLMAVGGAWRLIFPQFSEATGRWVLEQPASLASGGVIWLLIGLLLTYFGYLR